MSIFINCFLGKRLYAISCVSFPSVPSLLFEMAHIPPLKGEWSIRLPQYKMWWTMGKSIRVSCRV